MSDRRILARYDAITVVETDLDRAEHRGGGRRVGLTSPSPPMALLTTV
ncbi:MAG TPA: hypothetical protein VN461_04850 [Vicinamibacteria bacterium]|nr:hypothetical protein [Vicinamibacteria bacterium]